MRVADKRGNKCYQVSEEFVRVEFLFEDGRKSFPVFEVSKLGLSINIDQNDRSIFRMGEEFEGVMAWYDGECLGQVDLTVTEQLPIDGTRECNVWLDDARIETDSQVLWKLIYYSQPGFRPQEKIEELHHNAIPRIPGRGLYTEKARQERLEFLRENTPSPLEHVEETRFDPQQLTSNVEAFIGSIEIPVGAAGPLLFQGQHAQGMIYAPLATSEGALVASATRGATAITCSGGVKTRVLGQRMLRAPLFVLSDMNTASFFADWVSAHFYEIRRETQKYSNYASLVSIEPQIFGKNVHVHFVYETGDAAGQNMTTSCTWHACLWILKQMEQYPEINFDNFIIEANLSNDKKVTYQSFIKGRGIRVMAEATLTETQLERVLKVSADQLYEAYQGFINGSTQAGMIGFNINVANIVGAMFAALGQDIACVHECSLGQFHMERVPEGVYVSMMMPSLIVGTVGGGTWLPQQKELLKMIGCSGVGHAHRLAEIIAGYCLSLDISTLSAIAAGHFAKAHEKLGRNRPVEYLKKGDLNEAFFEQMMRKQLEDDSIRVLAAKSIESQDMETSIITQMTGEKSHKVIGHMPYELEYEAEGQVRQKVRVMVKSKPTSGEVVNMFNNMAAMCDARLASEYNKHKETIGFKGCDSRELAVLSQKDERFTPYVPKIYGTFEDKNREIFLIVEEHLENTELMDSADDISGWTEEHIKAAIDGITSCHAIWYGREQELLEQPWLDYVHTKEGMKEKERLWELLAAHAEEEFPEWILHSDMNDYRNVLHKIDYWWGQIESMPKTLIHNDFNPRNITFRRDENDELRVCAYDWELATIGLPQHDLAELLVFTIPEEDANMENIAKFVEYHRLKLEEATGQSIDAEQWMRGFMYAFRDLMVNRLAMYVMAHTFRHFEFMPRVFASARRIALTVKEYIDENY